MLLATQPEALEEMLGLRGATRLFWFPRFNVKPKGVAFLLVVS